jgi:hypothetical protein
MGEDARWVCHDCKTVCSRGGNPIIKRPLGDITTGEIDAIKENVGRLGISITLHKELRETWYSFLNDLRKWVSRHQGHSTYIGSDYTTDVMELDDYRDETVDGKVNDYTRLEAKTRTAEGWRNAGIEKIKGLIMEHSAPHGVVIDLNAAATALYDQLISDIAAELGG